MNDLPVYIVFRSDEVEEKISNEIRADNPDEVRRIFQAMDIGSHMWESWALRRQGEVIALAEDEGILRVSASWLKELPEIRSQYEHYIGTTVSVGVGQKLSEASKAMAAQRKEGGDGIRLYTPEVDEVLGEESLRKA